MMVIIVIALRDRRIAPPAIGHDPEPCGDLAG
jgi:hypothetical protein